MKNVKINGKTLKTNVSTDRKISQFFEIWLLAAVFTVWTEPTNKQILEGVSISWLPLDSFLQFWAMDRIKI